jgi:hypothetical protein
MAYLLLLLLSDIWTGVYPVPSVSASCIGMVLVATHCNNIYLYSHPIMLDDTNTRETKGLRVVRV